jgi:signal transduction histidine kinase
MAFRHREPAAIVAGNLLPDRALRFQPASPMTFANRFAQQGRGLISTELTILILLIGVVDFNTGYEVSMSIFYGVPIFVCAWFCTKKDAILIALLAGLVWWWADVQAGHPYLNSWQEGWETFIRIAYFIFIAIGGASLREQRDVAAGRIALLERTQRLEREIIGISEREQRRIGQDLHDGICQYLAALGCAAASLRGDLEKLNLAAEANVAGELSKLLQDAVVQTRDLARGLAPVHMDNADLALALEDLALSVTRLQGINCRFETSGPPKTYEETSAMHLYRIAQEAINNATKHGKARTITLSLNANDDMTTLQIADDGKGISKTTPSGRGMGLSIMNYRARLSGGELQIEQLGTGGTLVSCTLDAKKT